MTPPSPSNPTFANDAERFACYAARLVGDSRCEQVIVIDVRGHSQVTDYLVIASGTSERQLRSVAGGLKELARDQGQGVFRADAGDGSGWVVMDFVDVVAHLFTPHQRAYYDLETLWGDGEVVDWVNRTTPGQFARIGSSQRGSVD